MFVYKKISLLLSFSIIHFAGIAMNKQELARRNNTSQQILRNENLDNHEVHTIGADLQHGGKYMAVTKDATMLTHSLSQLNKEPRPLGRGSSKCYAKL